MITLLYSLCAADILLAILLALSFRGALRRLRRKEISRETIRPDLDVIMPARNEARDIAEAVQSVLLQKHVVVRIFAVNDHSSDGTGRILDEIASSDSRLQVIHDPPLRDGWLGKCNAMQTAFARVETPIVVLCDADVRHAPECFVKAVCELEHDELDLVSYFPYVEGHSFWEQQLLPMVVFGLAWFGGPAMEREASPHALAAGAFIAVRTDVLRELGGFEVIKTAVFDDVELARTIKRAGWRTRLRLAPQLLRVRLFKGNRDAFWGPTKNVLGLFEGRDWLAIPLILFVVTNLWSPLVAMVAGIALRDSLLGAAGLAAYLAQLSNVWMGRQTFEFRIHKAVFFPLSAVSFTCCTLRALYHHLVHGAVYWRGRSIRVRSDSS